MTFDGWFLKFSSWGLSHEQLVHASIRAPGDSPGDVVYTSPSGNVLTRHMCSHWINFYGAASAGWNAALSIKEPCPGCDGHECIRNGEYDCQYPGAVSNGDRA